MVQSSAQPTAASRSTNPPLVCHVLIGPPGCGKSTLAAQWVERHPETVIVSSDRIRHTLYGDATIQGTWAEIEADVLGQIQAALVSNTPVIYDATNTHRAWRIDLMAKIRQFDQIDQRQTRWMGWSFKTPMETCCQRNQQRDRQVPEAVIERSHAALLAVQPNAAEGFSVINPVPMTAEGWADLAAMETKLKGLERTMRQRARRQNQYQLHPYSGLLEFEQLLYLIATVLHYPGIGTLHKVNPSWLQQELSVATLPTFASPVEEIAALIAHQYGRLYADVNAIARNLEWLEQNHLVNAGQYTAEAIQLASVEAPSTVALHAYADRDAFERLMQLIRFIVHHPFLRSPVAQIRNTKLHETLATAMDQHNLDYTANVLRYDISNTLKSYDIMPKTSMRHGYYLGPAILAKTELLQLFHSLEAQAKRLDDPITLATYETFQERLSVLKLNVDDSYPVRTVVNRAIVNPQYLPDNSLALAPNAELVESAIAQSKFLELRLLRGTGRFEGHDAEQSFLALPLQIVFRSIAWYLGYMRREDGFLKFERLDRLTARTTPFVYARQRQAQQRHHLHQLLAGSFGLFLGRNAKEQQQFLSADETERAQVTDTLELWCNNTIFRFLCEGTQRLPGLKLSPRIDGSWSQAEKKTVFCLKPTGHPYYPHRLRATLPRWVFKDDVDLRAWILRFGGQVKVVKPTVLVKAIKQYGQDICAVYESDGLDRSKPSPSKDSDV